MSTRPVAPAELLKRKDKEGNLLYPDFKAGDGVRNGKPYCIHKPCSAEVLSAAASLVKHRETRKCLEKVAAEEGRAA